MSDIQINREALFSAETQDYRMPSEPDAGDMVTVRMRTAKTVADHVYYIEKKKAVLMKKSASDSLFDYYEHKITVKEAQILYHFKIENDDEVCHYNRLGPSDQDTDQFDFKDHTRLSYPGLGKGRSDVPDFCGPLLQWLSH